MLETFSPHGVFPKICPPPGVGIPASAVLFPSLIFCKEDEIVMYAPGQVDEFPLPHQSVQDRLVSSTLLSIVGRRVPKRFC